MEHINEWAIGCNDKKDKELHLHTLVWEITLGKGHYGAISAMLCRKHNKVYHIIVAAALFSNNLDLERHQKQILEPKTPMECIDVL